MNSRSNIPASWRHAGIFFIKGAETKKIRKSNILLGSSVILKSLARKTAMRWRSFASTTMH